MAEIQSGLARPGRMLACDWEAVQPDLVGLFLVCDIRYSGLHSWVLMVLRWQCDGLHSGELMEFYKFTPIAVIGGSFLPGLTDHNISEVAIGGSFKSWLGQSTKTHAKPTAAGVTLYSQKPPPLLLSLHCSAPPPPAAAGCCSVLLLRVITAAAAPPIIE
ncbi:hypothetical protein L1887_24164 [Cichorium endivia]|nr:hypothetical protein L1887_24164 [Cichorium endivia]